LSGAVTYGVSLTGGTRLAASGCAVVTNSGVSATSGTAITAAQVVAGKTVNDEAAQWGTPGITTTPTAKNIKENKSGAASDTVGTDSRVVAGFAKVGYADPVTAPGNGAQAYNFDSNHSGAVSKYWNGGTGSYTLPAGTYDMTSMSVSTPVTFQNNAIIHVSGNISVGGGMKLAIGNNASLDVGGSITLGGSATMTVASGNVTIGKDASGFAINTGGSAVLSFGDGTFSANGNITTGGASSIGFGVTKYHYINGTLTLNGSASFGAGGYFINGNFVGTSGGNITGSNVTFFLAGALQGSGASIMNLSAPTDDNGGGVTDLLFATKSSAASSLGAGSSAVYGGMIYAPNSDMSFSGAATANGGSRCFSVVVSTFTMSGGSATGSACTGIGSGGSGSSGVRLLQ
jgi:hypothetical protein